MTLEEKVKILQVKVDLLEIEVSRLNDDLNSHMFRNSDDDDIIAEEWNNGEFYK